MHVSLLLLARASLALFLFALPACGGGGSGGGGYEIDEDGAGAGSTFGTLVVCAQDSTNSGWFIFHVEVQSNATGELLEGAATTDHGECAPFSTFPAGNYLVRAHFTNLASAPVIRTQSSVNVLASQSTMVTFTR